MLGTERHESRRIDNQLRGRSGRQGDPGRSKFFLSLEDDLMRIFGSNKLDGMLQKLGLKENEAIVHPWINKALEKAQQKVEARNFDIRKNILKFDNVMNDQRTVIFKQRVEWMSDAVTAEVVSDMRHAVIEDFVGKHVPENAYPEQWDVPQLKEDITRVLGLDLPIDEWAKEEGIADEELSERIKRRADEHMAAKVAQWGPDVLRYVEKSILLADARPSLARAPRDAGASAPGDRAARLRPARPAQRIQGRGVQPVRDHEPEPARGGHRPAHARRDRAAAAGARSRPCRRCRPRTSIPTPARTRWRSPPPARSCWRAMAFRRGLSLSATRRIREAGARSAATNLARAAQARSTSTATAATPSFAWRETIGRAVRCLRGNKAWQTMQIPLEIAFHNIDKSDWAETAIRDHVARLEEIYRPPDHLPGAGRPARQERERHDSTGGPHRDQRARPQGHRGGARAGSSSAQVSDAGSAERHQRGIPDRRAALERIQGSR